MSSKIIRLLTKSADIPFHQQIYINIVMKIIKVSDAHDDPVVLRYLGLL